MRCSLEKAKSIYNTALFDDIAEELLLQLEGLSESEYKQALKLYLKTLPEVDTDRCDDDATYREFQEANWNEYFEPARTYRYVYGYR